MNVLSTSIGLCLWVPGIKYEFLRGRQGDQRASTLGFRNQIWLPQSQGSSCYQIVNINPSYTKFQTGLSLFNGPCNNINYYMAIKFNGPFKFNGPCININIHLSIHQIFELLFYLVTMENKG